eukprot:m.64396 g.64396  ORF g.64396 m.64396 type:complete len:504 (+) comp11647_c0_seq1:194-1705(+)
MIAAIYITASFLGALQYEDGNIYRMYSCDTQNITIENYVFSATSLQIENSPECPQANATVDPLGPCFTSPSQIKAILDNYPPGGRAISLEGLGMYYLQGIDPVTKQLDRMYFMDRLANGVSGPWFDEWAAALKKRFTVWFAKFKEIGGDVDIILSDFEMGGKASFYSFSHQSPNATAFLIKDSRWPALQAQLNKVGEAKNVTFSDDEVLGMALWNQSDWHRYVWDKLLVDTMIPQALNSSVFEPIKASFPNISFSNFAHGHRSDPEFLPQCLHGWWPHSFSTSSQTPIGTGSHVGTHQSKGFYGGSPSTNTSHILQTSTQFDLRSVEGNAFNALLQSVAVARDMKLGAPFTPVHPWFAPKYGLWHECGANKTAPCGWSWLAGSGGENDTMWEENVFHVALSTAAVTWLWWQPGLQQPIGLGLDTAVSAMKELEQVIHAASGTGRCTPKAPILGNNDGDVDDSHVPIADGWASSYLLSGMELECVSTQQQQQQQTLEHKHIKQN